MAGTTGLEPATSAVTGQHSNQLNYVPTLFSSTCRKSQNLLSFRAVYFFLPLPPIPQNLTEFREEWTAYGQHEILPSMPLRAIPFQNICPCPVAEL
jgi:hypothetical protein